MVAFQGGLLRPTPPLKRYHFFMGENMYPTDTEIPLQEVVDRFEYDPETGIIRWKDGFGSQKSRKEAGGIFTYRAKYRYKRIRIKSRRVMYHRVAWVLYYGAWPDGEIDHISGDTLDNRISNLREVDQKDNKLNKAVYSNNTSGYPGVFKKKGRWYAVISSNGRNIPLGGYKTFTEAKSARLDAEIRYGYHRNHGERHVIA